MQRLLLGLVSAFMLVISCSALSAGPHDASSTQAKLSLYKDLPRDPLLVAAFSVEDPAAAFEQLTGIVRKFTTGVERRGFMSLLEQMEAKLGSPLSEAVLSGIGPELALAVDVQPIDEVALSLGSSQGNLLGTLLSRIGFVAAVREPEKVERGLRKMFEGLLVEPAQNGVTHVLLPSPVSQQGLAPAQLSLFYAVGGGRLALGFSPEWVAASVRGRAEGERLIDGRDYASVFAHLDERASRLVYVNLPRLRELVTGSQIINKVLAATPEAQDFVRMAFTQELMGIGLGSTSIVLDGGVRTTHFGPAWSSGGAVASSLLAAVAIPGFMRSGDRGRSQKTVEDMRAIALACEQFSGDAEGYPGPTEGWVPVERIAVYLEPVYIASLPRTDGWRNPILYWSNGGTYRIISTGKDGKMERDWSGQVEPGASADADGDIVFADGKLVVHPSTRSE